MKQLRQSLARKITRIVRCKYLLFLPNDYARQKWKRWPLILFLHGAGQRGSDLEQLKEHGVPKVIEHRPDFPFIVVSPQCPLEGWWSADVPAALLDEIGQKYRVDTNRVYVTGLSMGGFGTWQLALEFPRRFAAIVPICGGGNPLIVHRIKQLPVWAFHGAKDEIVSIAKSKEMVRALRKCGGNVKFTAYPDAAHDSWTRTYENPRLYEWFLKHKRTTK